MPSINEVIARVSRRKPSAVEDGAKAQWLIDLDGQLYAELTGADAPEALPPAQWPEDGDKPLLVGAPYDGLYDWWLIAQVEFATDEYANYNNTVTMFNQAMNAFKAHYRQEHRPAGRAYTNVMGGTRR